MIKTKLYRPLKIPNLLLLLIIVGAFFLRSEYTQTIKFADKLLGDSQHYLLYGYNLAVHQTFSKEHPSNNPKPDSFRSPGYPYLISLAIKVGGPKRFMKLIIYIQVILSTLLVPLTFFCGRYFFSFWWAFATACMVAISPHLVSMTSVYLSETLFSFLLLTAIYCYMSAISYDNLILSAASGFFFGCAYLTNETALFLPFIFSLISIGILMFQKETEKKQINTNTLVFLLVFILFPAGWTIRNKINLPDDTLTGSSRAVKALSHGAYPGFLHKNLRYKYYPYKEDLEQPVFGSSISNFCRILRQRFTEKPARYLRWYFIEKPYCLWSWDNLQSQLGNKKEIGRGDIYVYPVRKSLYHISTTANLTRRLMKLTHPFILVLSIVGAISFLIEIHKTNNSLFTNKALILLIFLFYYTALYSVFVPWPRYSVPFRPMLYLWALFSLKIITKRLNTNIFHES